MHDDGFRGHMIHDMPLGGVKMDASKCGRTSFVFDCSGCCRPEHIKRANNVRGSDGPVGDAPDLTTARLDLQRL
jgi:hypothetical protein